MSSDDEAPQAQAEHDPQFESANAGASTTYPMQASAIRKGGFVVIKGRPAKVVDVSTSKTGKHGHAKCHFVAVDIFNKKKYEDLTPSTHNMDVPFVSKTEFEVADVQDDGFLSLMDANGNMKDDLQLPSGDDEDYKVAEAIKAYFNDGKTVMVSVTKAMGEEKVDSCRTIA